MDEDALVQLVHERPPRAAPSDAPPPGSPRSLQHDGDCGAHAAAKNSHEGQIGRLSSGRICSFLVWQAPGRTATLHVQNWRCRHSGPQRRCEDAAPNHAPTIVKCSSGRDATSAPMLRACNSSTARARSDPRPNTHRRSRPDNTNGVGPTVYRAPMAGQAAAFWRRSRPPLADADHP